MRALSSSVKMALALLIVFQSVVPPRVQAGERIARIKRFFKEAAYKGTEPCMGKDCAMECLAENIDWLEHHIDTYGSVVAKQPDIWGEARLTKHRDEYERVMFGELGEFNDTINASITNRDASFLAQSLALASAATKTSTPPPKPANTSVTVQNATATLPGTTSINASKFERFGITTKESGDADPRIKLEPVTHLDQQSRYLKHLHELRRINEGDDTSDSPGYSLNLVRIPVSITPGKITREGFGAEITVTAEPVISDDLMPTTFRNLAVNDVVDFLGLPLVRMTERLESYDAIRSERDFSATISEIERIFGQYDANPNEVIRQKLEQDLVTQVEQFFKNRLALKEVLERFSYIDVKIGEALSQVAVVRTRGSLSQAQPENRATYSPTTTTYSEEIDQPPSILIAPSVKSFIDRSIETIQQAQQTRTENSQPALPEQAEVDGFEEQLNAGVEGLPAPTGQMQVAIANGQPSNHKAPATLPALLGDAQILSRLVEAMRKEDAQETALTLLAFSGSQDEVSQAIMDESRRALNRLKIKAGEVSSAAPSGRTRRALNPLNPSSLDAVIGVENLIEIAEFFEQTYYGKYIRWSGGNSEKPCSENRVNLLDARRFLDAEIKAAYELLCVPQHLGLFSDLARPDSGLASQIRGGHLKGIDPQKPSVEWFRNYFFRELHAHDDAVSVANASGAGGAPLFVSSNANLNKANDVANSPVEALAWAIVVESALLNQRLNQDVRKLAKSKEAFHLDTPNSYWFFLPDAVNATGNGHEQLQAEFQSANEIFKEYVRVRWPIHVFAVDPVNQDQNVADVSQRSRELQFAMALGFASGQIGANSLTQYSRKMESQVETIALNRTIVGFGHGSDTFGWRFYPRVQGLDVPGTLGSLRETFMGASRDYDKRHRQIEPGQRECVAVVLMPSFVPYADFDVRTDWFKLTNPKNTALTMKDGLKLSRAVTAMRNSRATCAKYQHLYREGELRRLIKRVDQLDRELPLQTQRAMVPYENTLGGFEMFNTGVTDLSPELIGWHGAPGINLNENDCGCYQGCSSIKLDCNTPDDCDKVTKSIKSLNAAVANSPYPACQGKGTTLFLVGDNFSVHDTKIIAGGICIPHVRLISRELMQVTIPHCVNTVELCENGETEKYVAIYVATPYGVTNHLHVPVAPQAKACSGCAPSVVTQNPTAPSRPDITLAEQTGQGRSVLQSSYSATSYLNDSTSTTSPVRLASLMESSEELDAIQSQLMTMQSKLDVLEAGVRASFVAPAQSLVDLQVNLPPSNFLEQEQKGLDGDDFPIFKRLRSSVSEQWRNCRDQLPGN